MSRLPIESSAQLGFNRYWVISHNDLTAASGSQAFSIETDIGASVAFNFFVYVKEGFRGGSSTACTLDVGVQSDIDGLIDGQVIFGSASDGLARLGTDSREIVLATGTNAGAIRATITATGDNVNDLTHGELIIYGTVIEAKRIGDNIIDQEV